MMRVMSQSTRRIHTVMAGLVPAIHASPLGTKNVDARDKPGHDDEDRFSL
jgi:hypothetical protein